MGGAMKRNPNQLDLPINSGEFNFQERRYENHSVRVTLSDLDRAIEQAKAREYGLKMQRVFAQCPGFIGGDAPETERSTGWVVVAAASVTDSVKWLKRRFQVNPKMEVDGFLEGLRIEIAPRRRPVMREGKRQVIKVDFNPPEQFTLL